MYSKILQDYFKLLLSSSYLKHRRADAEHPHSLLFPLNVANIVRFVILRGRAQRQSTR